jgi:hypothetical protein
MSICENIVSNCSGGRHIILKDHSLLHLPSLPVLPLLYPNACTPTNELLAYMCWMRGASRKAFPS